MKKIQTIIVVGVFVLLSILLLVVANRFPQELKFDQRISNPRQTSTDMYQITDTAKSLQTDAGALQPVSTTQQHGLTVRFTADRAYYTLGEPVLITVTARNQTTEPILFYDGFDIVAGLIGVQVASNGSEFHYYNGPFPMASQEFFTSTLSPGTGRSLSFYILANEPAGSQTLPDFYAFPEPGSYQLRAVLQHIIPNETLFSESITIQLLQPTSIDAQIWRLLQTEDTAKFLQAGYAKNPASIAGRFATILEQYPNSFYAPSLRAAIEEYQNTQVQAGESIQSATAEPPPTIRDINNQLYLVQSAHDDTARAASASDRTLGNIVDAVQEWTDAWNAADLDRYAHAYSYSTTLRERWGRGSGDFSHEKIRKRVKALFEANGDVSVEIIGFTVGADEITLEVNGRFERGNASYTFDTMRFVQDWDLTWRLYSPEF